MDELTQSNGIQSIDYTAQLLELFCQQHARLSLKEIALALDDSPAKVYRYLVSLTRIGLLNKTDQNEYEVGNLALDLSVKALNQLDPLEEAFKTAKRLNYETSYGVAVSVWGSLGPTVIKTFEPKQSVYSQIRVGSVMSLVNSSIGQTFAKYLPEHILKHALDIDVLRHSGEKFTSVKEKNEFIQHIHQEKTAHFTLMVDRPSLGLSSLSIPIFSISEEIQFVLTVFNKSEILLHDRPEFESYLLQQVKVLSENIGLNASI